MMLRRGQGYHAEIGGLRLKVEVRDEGWQYRVHRPNSNQVPNWTTPQHPSTSGYGEPENAKFQAVSEALLRLERINDDAHEVARNTTWTPYGPGQGA